jgi:GNAT superfamily N-acetyltransferase
VHGSNAAEVSMLVSDPYQKQGLGTALLGFQLRNAPEVVEAWVDLAGWQPPLEAGGQPA